VFLRQTLAPWPLLCCSVLMLRTGTLWLSKIIRNRLYSITLLPSHKSIAFERVVMLSAVRCTNMLHSWRQIYSETSNIIIISNVNFNFRPFLLKISLNSVAWTLKHFLMKPGNTCQSLSSQYLYKLSHRITGLEGEIFLIFPRLMVIFSAPWIHLRYRDKL